MCFTPQEKIMIYLDDKFLKNAIRNQQFTSSKIIKENFQKIKKSSQSVQRLQMKRENGKTKNKGKKYIRGTDNVGQNQLIYEKQFIIQQKQNSLYSIFVFLYFLISIKLYPIYIDETGIGNDYRQKVWSKIGQNSIPILLQISKGQLQLVLLDKDLVFFQYIKQMQTLILRKTLIARFIQFYNEIFGQGMYFFILDNSFIHQEQFLKQHIVNQISHLYIPPYCPQLNPIGKV
ncbi:unnamed protein product [Paramecium pentaurelia]|uniref:Tc1-like transposase DDE domain-containing protein n=1 Tax=Paramecium pentaurelia TaxID=43138 RepID=A0A8S1YKF0_9CILI|nr:unnamed protein product [Paramecium pentaurelia]